jgi:excisionase family DNA binding protein
VETAWSAAVRTSFPDNTTGVQCHDRLGNSGTSDRPAHPENLLLAISERTARPGRREVVVITIPINTNSGIRIPARTPSVKPKKERTEKILTRLTASIREGADMLGVHKDTLMVLVKAGKIRSIKIGRRTLVSRQSLREFVDGKNEPENSVEKSDELQGKKE